MPLSGIRTQKARSHTKGDATRTRLLAAAVDALARSGYHTTKVSDIVRAAGLSQPTFYLYFASKEALFAELVATFQSRLQQLVTDTQLVDEAVGATLAASVQANLTAVYQLLDEDRQLTRLIFAQPDIATEVRLVLAALMSDQLARAQQRGLVRSTLDRDIVALALVGIVEQLAQHWLLSGKKSAAVLAAAHTDLVLNGILAHATH